MHAYTVVVTSCNRFDLLEKTLASLLPRLDGNLQEIIIAEDSGKEDVSRVLKNLQLDAQVLLNRPQLGQLGSIDRAYAAVKTPYIFHCEDDWEFFGENFIAPSLQLLDAIPEISMVSLRPRSELNPLHAKQPDRECQGVQYVAADPLAHPEYFGYSFNPGMRRLSDYLRFGPLQDYQGEREVSYCFRQLGYYYVSLIPAAVRHSGWDRHVDDPMLPKRARSFTGKLKKSTLLRLQRLRRLLLPQTDPATQLRSGQGAFAESRLNRRAG
jgi:hypothetical protein